jgi:two-component system alkaline phosphatase synthesis response regulator PhoP
MDGPQLQSTDRLPWLHGIEISFHLQPVEAIMDQQTPDPRELPAVLRAYNLEIRPASNEACLGGNALALTKSEFRLLSLFLRNPGQIFTRQDILDRIYGNRSSCTARAIDTQICGLRKKLGPVSVHLQSIRGVGYRFDASKDHGS